MNIGQVKNSIVTESGNINNPQIKTVYTSKTFWKGFISGIISSIVGSIIYDWLFN